MVIFVVPCRDAAGKGLGTALHLGFYNRGCPKVEQIVAEIVSKTHQQDSKLPGALIRLFSHDCFVKLRLWHCKSQAVIDPSTMEIGPRLITAAVFAVTLCSMISVPCSADEVNNPGNGLHVGFYDRKCPNLEQIVTDVVAKAVETDQTLPAGLIRLFFHDCFVKGCDASILLDSTPSNEPVEMQSPANGGIRGIEVIEEIKARLEQECPETVSCADILAFATREAVAFSGLPRHQVPAGRRDSRTSRASDVILPSPATPMDEIIDFFSRRNLTPEEMVVLFGAHSIGTVHCSFFDYRLYNFAPGQLQDPSLNPVFAAELAQQCPAPNTLQGEEAENKVVDLDTTPLVLDNHYYMNLIQGRALMQSDQALATNPRTGAEVAKLAIRSDSWARQFVRAIIKMGRINVLTGDAGEIRKNCRNFN